MSIPSAIFPNPPDPALRRPFTATAFLPLYLCHYALAVLAILPHTFILRLALTPIVLWQAWNCAVGLDFSAGLARSLGLESSARINYWNFPYVMGMFNIALKSLEWAFEKKPLRRYEPPAEGQRGHRAPIERRLSIPSVLLDAFDLVCNLRGIGWSWSYRPFPRPSNRRSTSILSILARLLFKLLVFDVCHCLIQHVRPSVDLPAGDTLFDPTLSLIQRCACVAFVTLCGGLAVYTIIDVMYHILTLVGRIVLRQQAWQWPPLSDRPWMSTSIADFWSLRWHQVFRHPFVVYGARPGGAVLGRPGALVGAFTMSAVVHDLGMWGVGRGTEFSTAGGFFVLMGVGAALEHAFARATGRSVGGVWGWAWTMAWTLAWGTLIMDAWARRGMIACDLFPDGMRPGKPLVDITISFLRRYFHGEHLPLRVDNHFSHNLEN
ncbi:hypothetical protein BJV74DRAFT_953746 [Russula compacta]|nr:hypothetical protein BJV74DRAFT_953746 [Russula compacta]